MLDKKGNYFAIRVAHCLVDVKGYTNINQVNERDFSKSINHGVTEKDKENNPKYLVFSSLENHPLYDKIARYIAEINYKKLRKSLNPLVEMIT